MSVQSGLTLTLQQKRLVRQSFESVQEYSDAVVQLFYGRLFELQPGVRSLFKVNIKDQSAKLLEMMSMIVDALDHFDQLRLPLAELGRKHITYGTQPAHYETFRVALLWALGQALGIEFDRETRAAWDKVIREIAAAMLEGTASPT